MEVWSPLSYCPRSSLPANVLAWLASRLAHLAPSRPPGRGGTPPLALEVRLDAVAAVLLDGLSYRRAARMVGICKTEVGDSLDLLLGELAALGFCQPDGTFAVTLQDLGELLAEMATSGETVCVDGLATRVQRPSGWANQKVLYDAKRHTHTAQGLALSTIHGDLGWCDGGWPGSCHEHQLLALAGLDQVLDAAGVASLLDRLTSGSGSPVLPVVSSGRSSGPHRSARRIVGDHQQQQRRCRPSGPNLCRDLPLRWRQQHDELQRARAFAGLSTQ
jgi:DDE superfamily endonuclease